ncbi:hypothetical protein JCM11491_001540 [Sporobolomyces phaffii]
MSNATTLFDPANLVRDTSALLGPQTAGWQFGFVVYGSYLSLHVSYVRSDAYSRLAPNVKLVIWGVFGLVTLYELLAYSDCFRYMILVQRTPQDIILGWWVDFIVSLIAGMVAAVVQTFLTIRASVLIRNQRVQLVFLGFMGIGILASFTGAILTTATSFMYANDTIDKVSISFNQSVALWLWSAAAVDVAISLSLLVTLKQRYAGSNNPTDSLLRKLILVSLQTAAYTSFLAVAGAVVSLVFKDSHPAFALLHFAFWTPLPPCYAVSLYTTLATRQHLDEHLLGTAVYALDGGGGGRGGGRGAATSRDGIGPMMIATREIAPFGDGGGGGGIASTFSRGVSAGGGGGGGGAGGGGGWSQTGLYSPTIFAPLWEQRRDDAARTDRRGSDKTVASFLLWPAPAVAVGSKPTTTTTRKDSTPGSWSAPVVAGGVGVVEPERAPYNTSSSRNMK